MYFVGLGEVILQVGHVQKRKAQQSQSEAAGKERDLPTCSRCNGAGHRSGNKKCPAQVV